MNIALRMGIGRLRSSDVHLDDAPFDKATKKIAEGVYSSIQKLVEYEMLPDDLLMIADEVDGPGALADVVLAHLKEDVEVAHSALAELDPNKRLSIADSLLLEQLQRLELHQEIQLKTNVEISKGQRDYFLREQLKVIRSELGEADEDPHGLGELARNLEKAKASQGGFGKKQTNS